jgi:hypothetical protein
MNQRRLSAVEMKARAQLGAPPPPPTNISNMQDLEIQVPPPPPPPPPPPSPPPPPPPPPAVDSNELELPLPQPSLQTLPLSSYRNPTMLNEVVPLPPPVLTANVTDKEVPSLPLPPTSNISSEETPPPPPPPPTSNVSYVEIERPPPPLPRSFIDEKEEKVEEMKISLPIPSTIKVVPPTTTTSFLPPRARPLESKSPNSSVTDAVTDDVTDAVSATTTTTSTTNNKISQQSNTSSPMLLAHMKSKSSTHRKKTKKLRVKKGRALELRKIKLLPQNTETKQQTRKIKDLIASTTESTKLIETSKTTKTTETNEQEEHVPSKLHDRTNPLAQLGRIAEILKIVPSSSSSSSSSLIVHQVQPSNNLNESSSPNKIFQASNGIGSTISRAPAQGKTLRYEFVRQLPILTSKKTTSIGKMISGFQNLLNPLIVGAWFRVGSTLSGELPLCFFRLSGDMQSIDWTKGNRATTEICGSLQRNQIKNVECCKDGSFILHILKDQKKRHMVELRLMAKEKQMQIKWCTGLAFLLKISLRSHQSNLNFL